MDNKELLPCPFCGGDAVFAYETYYRLVACSKCGASTRKYNYFSQARDAWNVRKSEVQSNDR